LKPAAVGKLEKKDKVDGGSLTARRASGGILRRVGGDCKKDQQGRNGLANGKTGKGGTGLCSAMFACEEHLKRRNSPQTIITPQQSFMNPLVTSRTRAGGTFKK
jgi:hypothetical protein